MTKQLDTQAVSKPQYSQLAPQAIEMEEAVLSALLTFPKAVHRVSAILKPHHFYNDANKSVFAAISSLNDKLIGIDTLTVMEELKSQGNLESSGGVAYLSTLMMKVASSAHIETHAARVIDCWQRRELIRAGTQAISTAFDATAELTDTVYWLTEDLDRIQNLATAQKSLSDQLTYLLDKGEERFNRGEALLGPRIFDIDILDRLTDGGYPGGLTVIGGDSGSGKSSLFNTAFKACVHLGLSFYSWSGEMSADRQQARLIAAMTGINSRAIIKGMYRDAIKFPGGSEKVINAIQVIEQGNHVFDEGAMNLQRLTNTIAYNKRINGINHFFLDRKELFDLGDKYGDEGVAEIMARLRTIATQMELHIYVGSQLRKGFVNNAGSRPGMHDLLGSGSIFQSATCVIMTHRPELYKIFEDESGQSLKGKAELLVVKNTNGETGTVRVDFNKEVSLFTEEKDEETFSAPAYTGRIEPVRMNEDEDIPF